MPLSPEQAYRKYSSKFRWLVLLPAEGAKPQRLGCSMCIALETTRKKTSFASGDFVPGKLLYTRTFAQHETQSKVHMEAVARQPPAEEVHEDTWLGKLPLSCAKKLFRVLKVFFQIGVVNVHGLSDPLDLHAFLDDHRSHI